MDCQREGRAKNSDDRTQESLVKMFALSGGGDFLSNIRALNLVPVAISYEYDPCDYLKAQEMQLKRDDAGYKKQPSDDLKNMATGITGYKGRIHFEAAYLSALFLNGYLREPPGRSWPLLSDILSTSRYMPIIIYIREIMSLMTNCGERVRCRAIIQGKRKMNLIVICKAVSIK